MYGELAFSANAAPLSSISIAVTKAISMSRKSVAFMGYFTAEAYTQIGSLPDASEVIILELAKKASALAETGDIPLHGWDVAQDAAGAQFS
jgi:hypothetical protein